MKNQRINKNGFKSCNDFLVLQCFKYRIYLFWFRTYESIVNVNCLWSSTRSMYKHAKWFWVPAKKIICETCTGSEVLSHYLCCTSMTSQANAGQHILTATTLLWSCTQFFLLQTLALAQPLYPHFWKLTDVWLIHWMSRHGIKLLNNLFMGIINI